MAHGSYQYTDVQQSNKLVIILNRLQYAIVWACAAKR